MNTLTKLQANYMTIKYRFQHWMFQWKQDDDGDIAFVVCGVLAFIKYKEHTIFHFNRKDLKRAPKYVRCQQ